MMADRTVSVSVDSHAALAALDRVKAAAGGEPATMRQVSLAMRQQVYNAFRFERAPDGTGWVPLSPLTLRARARVGNHSQQKLIATGAMYASIEAENTQAEASISVGSGLPDKRAWYNQMGTPRAPARPFLPMNESGPAPTQAWIDAVMRPLKEALEDATQ